MATKIDISCKETASLLTPELSRQVKRMRMRYALWESGCLRTNSDHGPWGSEYLMPRVPVQRGRVYTGTREAGSYSHRPELVKFRGRYYLAFHNGTINEAAPGQRIMVSSSGDGLQWTPARVAVNGDIKKGITKKMVGLLANKKELILYCGSEQVLRDAKIPGMRRTESTSRRMDTYTSTDGETWKLKEAAIFAKSNFEAPRPTREGLLLAGGSQNGPAAFIWKADKPWGRPETIRMPAPSAEAVFPYGEASWYQTDDGTIVMFWRDEGASERLYVNTSPDGGRTWSRPIISDFPDSMSRIYAGRLSDGRYFLVGNSYPKLLDRMHLMISISEDGYKFKKMYTLLDEPTAQRTKGLLKCHGYQYPCGLVDKEKLLIGYSINKEDIECGIVDTKEL